MAMMKCPNCGKEISDRGKICPHCMFWLDASYLAAKKQELIDEGERQYRETTEYRKREKEAQRLSKLPFCPICGTKDYVKRIALSIVPCRFSLGGLLRQKSASSMNAQSASTSGK